MGSFLLALTLTILALLFTLLPATVSLVYGTSKLVGGTELTDAIGHVLLLSVLTGTWYLASLRGVEEMKALTVAACLVLLLALTTEFAQADIADRGASLLDLCANIVGVGLAVVFIRRH